MACVRLEGHDTTKERRHGGCDGRYASSHFGTDPGRWCTANGRRERKAGSPARALTVCLQRLAGSEAFRSLFKEGMALVEETADYLDGDGRGESRRLTRAGALSYATESMRLTTRLMQLASWLLLQRAVNDGELSNEQARVEKSKVKLGGLATATHGSGWDVTAGKAEGADRPLAPPSGAYPAARRCVRTRRPAGNRQPGPGTDRAGSLTPSTWRSSR